MATSVHCAFHVVAPTNYFLSLFLFRFCTFFFHFIFAFVSSSDGIERGLMICGPQGRVDINSRPRAPCVVSLIGRK